MDFYKIRHLKSTKIREDLTTQLLTLPIGSFKDPVWSIDPTIKEMTKSLKNSSNKSTSWRHLPPLIKTLCVTKNWTSSLLIKNQCFMKKNWLKRSFQQCFSCHKHPNWPTQFLKVQWFHIPQHWCLNSDTLKSLKNQTGKCLKKSWNNLKPDKKKSTRLNAQTRSMFYSVSKKITWLIPATWKRLRNQ